VHKGIEGDTRRGATKGGRDVLTTETGLAFQKRYFAEQWAETCKAAGITGLHFHDIRGTTVTMLAEAGCTLPEIVSITGHRLRRAQEILDKYLARTSRLADSAIAKFENIIETDFAKWLQNARTNLLLSAGAPSE
jgi:integrase